MGSLGSTENVQTIFELLPCSVEHVRWNSRDRIPDTGLKVIKSVNWCSEYTALDIIPQEKNPVVLCLVNVEAKELDRLCRSIFLEMSCLGTRVPAYPNEVEHQLVGGKKKLPQFHCNLPQTACC
jgi:hypothetical protein